MKKNLGVKPCVYPQPVLMIASYNEDGTADAMNAAWGCMCDSNKVTLYLSSTHKTVENILREGEFSISIADAKHVVEADYVGVVSAKTVPDKLTRANLHTTKSDFVNAPVIEEFPLALECKMLSYDHETECMIAEIVNVCADTEILTEDGKVDPGKLEPITFDAVNHAYLVVREKVGNAFHDGFSLNK